MDEQTALVLALQLVALFSIAGALLVYLLCKIKATNGPECSSINTGAGRAILVTSADSALGLQITIHLANCGFRVFAGLKEGAFSGDEKDSVSARVIRAWQKHRESLTISQGALIALPLDVTREDLLHEAVDIIRAHLPAGEDGIWAVFNTSGLSYRGRLDQQDINHWDAILKTNVIGILRTARTFLPLLRNTRGRFITIGSSPYCESGLVAYNASRYAVEGASESLRKELSHLGIKVIVLRPGNMAPEALCAPPKIKDSITNGYEFMPTILSPYALQVLDVIITTSAPKDNYSLMRKTWCTTFK